MHGLVASPFKAGYVAAKHGAVGLVKTLALEGAPHGIRAERRSAPGFVRTPLVERQVVAIGRAARDHRRTRRCSRTSCSSPQAIKELIEPSEVADVAAFLLGPGGRSFTGAPVVLDNGWTAR